MRKNVTQKLIESHLVEGRMQAGEEVGLKIDQTLTQDATGTMVMLELEAMGLRRVKRNFLPNTWITTCFKPISKTRTIIFFCAAPAKSLESGIAVPEMASAIRCTWSASAFPVRRCSARTATPVLLVRSV